MQEKPAFTAFFYAANATKLGTVTMFTYVILSIYSLERRYSQYVRF